MNLDTTIVLVGFAITFITQLMVLLIEYQNQRKLALLQEQFTLDREKRQYILTDKLSTVRDLESWFNRGRQLLSESETLQELRNLSSDYPNQENEYDVLRNELTRSYRDWQREKTKHLSRAELIYNSYGRKINIAKNLPKDLSAITMALDHLVEAQFANLDRSFSSLTDGLPGDVLSDALKSRLFKSLNNGQKSDDIRIGFARAVLMLDPINILYKAGITVIERIKELIINEPN